MLEPGCAPGMTVGVETLDDVVRYDESGRPALLEQDKTTEAPITDGSIELWKALRIWAVAIKERQVDPDITELWLVSRSHVSSALARQMGAANTLEAAQTVADDLRKYQMVAAGGVTDLVAEVVSLSSDALVGLVRAFRLHQAQSAAGLPCRVQDVLRLNRLYVDLPDATVDAIARALWGHVTESIAAALQDHRPAMLARDQLARIERHELDRHRTHRALEAAFALTATHDDIHAHMAAMFVQQLRAIDSDEEFLLDAITDVVRCRTDRIRWAQQAEVSRTDLLNFDGNLQARWRAVRLELLPQSGVLGEPAVGRTILGRILQHREPLAGHPTEHQYTTSGRYHQLADDVKVWWHPRFPQLVPVGAGSTHAG